MRVTFEYRWILEPADWFALEFEKKIIGQKKDGFTIVEAKRISDHEILLTLEGSVGEHYVKGVLDGISLDV